MYSAVRCRYRLTQKADDTPEIVRKRIASYRSMQVGGYRVSTPVSTRAVPL
jgi:hypothetical protein